jgi:hypothetical protein
MALRVLVGRIENRMIEERVGHVPKLYVAHVALDIPKRGVLQGIDASTNGAERPSHDFGGLFTQA